MITPAASDLEGRRLSVRPEFRDHNPRRPYTHGWLAFEVLRRAPNGTLTFERYVGDLFDPEPDILAEAKLIPGQPNAYQQLKHIQCDIFRGTVSVDSPLTAEWYKIHRCGSAGRPFSLPREVK